MVAAPGDWHAYGLTKWNASAWLRRHFKVDAHQLAAARTGQLRLALGAVASADVTYVNGQRVGATGTFYRQSNCASALDYRSYGGAALAAALHLGDNVVAVNAWSAGGPLQGPRTFVQATGALPAGGDVLPPRSMPLRAAIARCNATLGCYGITYRTPRKAAPAGVPRTTYFKSERIADGDTRWTSYVVQRGQPGGLVDPAPRVAPGDARLGPFDPGASPGGKQTGYTVGGIGWYRRTFASPARTNVSVELLFEACYMRCTVFLNGVALGDAADGHVHAYGYTSFSYYLPPTLLAPPTQLNTLAVRVNNSGSNSRWYSGSGLFRPVTLLVHEHLHLAPSHGGGVYVTTPHVAMVTDASGTRATATAAFAVRIRNHGAAASAATTVQIAVRDPASSRKLLATTSATVPPIAAGGSALVNVSAVALGTVPTWSPAQPSLLEASLCLASDAGCTAAPGASTSLPSSHVHVETFGVRAFTFDAASGLTLNGHAMKLRGGCVHHDNGPLGSRAIPRAEERRVALLKASGYNAIRTSHNPPSRAFVEACDRLGMVLMVEAFDTWTLGKNPEDYHLDFYRWWRRDLATMVLRDRNSPSVLLWSIGNEIGIRHTPAGAALSATLSAAIRALDHGGGGSRRAITSAYPGPSADAATDAFFAALDVAGYNYAASAYERDHQRVPNRVMVATETFPMRTVEDLQMAENHSYVIGNFIWTAIDYIGESSIGASGHYTPSNLACGSYCAQPFSWHISSCGDLDIMGEPRAQSYLRRVMWGVTPLAMAVQRPGVEVIGAWGWPDEQQTWTWPGLEKSSRSSGGAMTVRVYASSGCVRVTLNGAPVAGVPGDGEVAAGEGAGMVYRRWRRRLQQEAASCVNVSNFAATFLVPYKPGVLRAELLRDTLRDGLTADSVTFHTAGPPVALRLTADRTALRASRDDLSYVAAELIDAAGNRVHCGIPHNRTSARPHDLVVRVARHNVFVEGGPPQRFAFGEADDDHHGGPVSESAVAPAWCQPVVVSFRVGGAGELSAVGSGDPIDPGSFSAGERRTYRGRAYAIVRPGQAGADGKVAGGGSIVVRAEAEGLRGAEMKISIGVGSG